MIEGGDRRSGSGGTVPAASREPGLTGAPGRSGSQSAAAPDATAGPTGRAPGGGSTPPAVSTLSLTTGVNAWAGDCDHVVVALCNGFDWRHHDLSRAQAVQLADQLYLLTRERP